MNSVQIYFLISDKEFSVRPQREGKQRAGKKTTNIKNQYRKGDSPCPPLHQYRKDDSPFRQSLHHFHVSANP